MTTLVRTAQLTYAQADWLSYNLLVQLVSHLLIPLSPYLVEFQLTRNNVGVEWQVRREDDQILSGAAAAQVISASTSSPARAFLAPPQGIWSVCGVPFELIRVIVGEAIGPFLLVALMPRPRRAGPRRGCVRVGSACCRTCGCQPEQRSSEACSTRHHRLSPSSSSASCSRSIHLILPPVPCHLSRLRTPSSYAQRALNMKVPKTNHSQ